MKMLVPALELEHGSSGADLSRAGVQDPPSSSIPQPPPPISGPDLYPIPLASSFPIANHPHLRLMLSFRQLMS